MQKILFISSEFPPGPGGIGNHGYNLISALKQKGYDVKIITNLENADENEVNKFAATSQLNITYTQRNGFLPIQIRRIISVFRLCKKNKFDYIICSGMFSLWAGRLMMLFFRKPKYIAVIHGSEIVQTQFLKKNFTNLSLKKFRTVISVSRFTQSLIKQKYSWQKHVVIPNAIDINFLSKFTNGEIKKLNGTPVLLTVGNVTQRKGQHNVIASLPQLIKKFPDIHYHCIGLPTLAEENLLLAKKLGVENYVSFHGKKYIEELMNAYRGCDVFVMLSENQKKDFEGFGIAILEANYFGKPAIGSLGCGIEDAIVDNSTGFLIKNKNISAFVSSLETIMSKYNLFSANAEQWAKKHNWNDVAEEYIKEF